MRLLLVEDDTIILKGLYKGINWTAVEGIEEADTAIDGEIALKKMEEAPFDIVVTDINMPFMDGLELAHHIKSRWPDVMVIILTGYSTFSYAKQALKLGVFDYLMKPVRPQELTACVTRAIAKLVRTRTEQRQLKATLPLLQRQFLMQLVHCKSPNPWRTAQELGLLIPQSPLQVALVLQEETPDNFAHEDEERFSMETALKVRTSGLVWSVNEHLLGVIASAPLADAMKDIRSSRPTLTIAIGPESKDISTINESYQSAWNTLESYGILYQGQLLDATNFGALHVSADIQALPRKLTTAVYQGEKQTAYRCIDSLKALVSPSEAQATCLNILFNLGEAATRLSDQHLLDKTSLHFEQAIKRIVSGEDPYAILRSVSSAIIDEIRTPQNTDPLNQKMIDYIKQHYRDCQLSLKTLGDYMGMSSAYLCSLFKQKNGMSFSDFIQNLRMERARMLLLSTTKKTYEIALEVGITNAQYFSARFKQLFGITPTEYREGKTN